MIRRGRPAGRAHGGDGSPVGVGRGERRAGLDDQACAGRGDAADEAVELLRVQAAEDRRVGVGQVGVDGVETAGGNVPGFLRMAAQPGEGVVDDDVDAGVVQRAAVVGRQLGAGQLDDAGVQLDLDDAVDARHPQQLAGGQPVAAAEDQRRAGGFAQGGIDQRFGVAVFVAAGVLQPAIEEEAGVLAGPRDDDLLVVAALRVDDRRGEQGLAGGDLDVADGKEQRDQRHRCCDEDGDRRDQRPAREHPAQQQHGDEQRRGDVDQAGHRRAAQHAEHRQHDERPRQAADERPQVVGGVEVGHDRAGFGGGGAAAVLQERHQQRDLRTDEHADRDGGHRQRRQRIAGDGEGQVQQRRGESADQAQRRLDAEERRRRPLHQRLGQQRAEPQRRDVPCDDDRGGHDVAAAQRGGQRQQRELVDQAARRARRHRRQQQRPPEPAGRGVGAGFGAGFCSPGGGSVGGVGIGGHRHDSATALISPITTSVTPAIAARGRSLASMTTSRNRPGTNASSTSSASACAAMPMAP